MLKTHVCMIQRGKARIIWMEEHIRVLVSQSLF